MKTTGSRIEQIMSAHPELKVEDVSLILCYYYKYEWSLAGSTLDEVHSKLHCITRTILDHERMNRPGQKFYKVLAESALRAVKLCQPLRVPSTGYERWKELQLNFDAREMLEG